MELLNKLNACQDAKLWAAGKTLSQAWQECQRADWMLWLLGRSQIDKKTIATIAVEFAEQCSVNAKEYPAVAECITTVKKYLSGQATQEELAAAESSAWSSVLAAESAAELAARAAAWAAAWAAWAARAADSAESAESAALAALAAGAAWLANCEIIRKHVSADEICKLFRKDGVE